MNTFVQQLHRRLLPARPAVDRAPRCLLLLQLLSAVVFVVSVDHCGYLSHEVLKAAHVHNCRFQGGLVFLAEAPALLRLRSHSRSRSRIFAPFFARRSRSFAAFFVFAAAVDIFEFEI